MPTVSLICHVERCRQNDSDTAKCFSLNLSVGLIDAGGDVDAAVMAWLRPWTWTIESITAAEIRGTAARLITDLKPLAPSLGSIAATDWISTLEQRLASLKGNASTFALEIFQWPQAPRPGHEANVYEYDGNDETLPGTGAAPTMRRWPAELLDVSREVAPFPHTVNLSRYFFVEGLADEASLAAVPVLKFAPDTALRVPGWALNDPPLPGDISDPDQPLHLSKNPYVPGERLEWVYVDRDGAGTPMVPSITAFSNAIPVADGTTGWVDMTHGVFGEDWLAEFEVRVADLFDLGDLILKFLGTLAHERADKARPSEQEEGVEIFREAFRVCLRDLVQTGSTCGTRAYPGARHRLKDEKIGLETEIGLAGDVVRELRTLTKARDTSGEQGALRALERWELSGKLGDVDALAPHWQEVLDRIWRAPKVEEGKPPVLADFAVLRAWHTQLADEQRLREIVFEQWDKVLASHAWWDARRETARANVLPSFAVRKRQLLMHLGIVWTDVVKVLQAVMPKEQDRQVDIIIERLAAALTGQLVIYLTDRVYRVAAGPFTDLPRATKEPPKAEWAAWRARFETWLQAHVVRLLREQVFSGSGAPEFLDPGIQPDGVVLQVAAVAATMEDETARHVAGFGVLMRAVSSGTGPTQCLTLADVSLATSSDDKVAASDVVVPARMLPRNGVQRGLITYNNDPICAVSPASLLSQQRQFDEQLSVTIPAWAVFGNPYAIDRKHQLPSLRFGTNYQAAAFSIGVGGTLPSQIAKAGDLTTYEQPPSNAPNIPWQDVRYRRRIGVSALRLGSGQRDQASMGDRLELPSIPASVHPVAQSLRQLAEERSRKAVDDLRALAELEPGQRLPAAEHALVLERSLGGSAGDLRESLVLLTPSLGKEWNKEVARTRFSFHISRPAVDLRVWDRSFDFLKAGKPNLATQRLRTQRAAVWAESFKNTRDSVVPVEGADVTLDDPVVGQALFRLTNLFAERAGGPSGDDPLALIVKFADVAGSGGLRGERSSSIGCEIASIASGSASLAVDGKGTVIAAVPAGEVWVLEIQPIVGSQFEHDFQLKLWTLGLETWTDQKKNVTHRLGAARRLVIEVATDRMPTPADCHTALRARAVAGGRSATARERWTDETTVWREARGVEALRADWRTEVALDPSLLATAASRDTFHWIHRVTVLVQRWRWNGRPLRDAPPAQDTDTVIDGTAKELTPAAFFTEWATGGTDQTQLTNWDGRLFGDRAGTDYRRHETIVDLTADGGPGAGAHLVFQQDISNDPGAVYFRFAVEVTSRYEGLVRRPPVGSRGGLQAPPKGPAVPEAWRRLVIPCRHTREIPPPRVKLVLPLTDIKDPAIDRTPGLLVVLSEPWFRYGGLAEELIVEAAVADEPVTGVEPRHRMELGADPIVARDARQIVVPPDESFPGAFTFNPLVAYGPIGYTFDTDTLAPEFIHTSFVVPAPELHKLEEPDRQTKIRDLAWHFVKLRFRRRFEPAGLALPLPVVESEATAPVWAQLLPPASILGEALASGNRADVAVGQLGFFSSGAGSSRKWFIARRARPAEPVKVRATEVESDLPAARQRFQLWALVTDTLFDAFGRRMQERFVDLCPIEDGVLQPIEKTWVPVDSGARRVRVLEMHVLPSQEEAFRAAATIDQVRLFLFPEDQQNLIEARARCVRVSAAIEQ